MSTLNSAESSRKRRLSDSSEFQSDLPLHTMPQRKRLCRNPSSILLGQPLPIINPNRNHDRLAKPKSLLDEQFELASTTTASRPASPSPFVVPSSYSKPGLVRSASASSLRSTTTTNYHDMSAMYNLRDTKISFDFSVPNPNSEPSVPLTCSSKNILFFPRGNRVHFKNMQANDDIVQLCKLQDKYGDIHLLECDRESSTNNDILAIATTKGTIQLWDVRAKKLTSSWSTKGVGAMQFNGPVLTVGGTTKGTIRFYDTRIANSTTSESSTTKMKSEVRKLTRHQSPITSLAWNKLGRLLATGDDSGAVYAWDQRQIQVPLDVGEFVSRRKKIQHAGCVTVVNWCPWQPKLLGTGDENGTLRLWDIDTSDSKSNALNPGKLELGSRITGLHFSPNYKEMITVHGSPPSSNPHPNQNPDSNPNSSSSSNVTRPSLSVHAHNTSNSIVAHSFPTLRHIHTLLAADTDKAIAGSVMNANFTKAVVAVPAEGRLKVFDVWGKMKRRDDDLEGLGIR